MNYNGNVRGGIMKKLIFSALSTLLLVQTGFAIYPLDRSSREISDIVRSPELRRLVPGTESILDVRRVQRGYIITTNRYQIIVDVMYGPSANAKADGEEGGPATFKFNEPTEVGGR